MDAVHDVNERLVYLARLGEKSVRQPRWSVLYWTFEAWKWYLSF